MIMKKIVIMDKRNHIEGKEVNGGGYIFTITYIPFFDEEGNKQWLVKYGTSSEFEYCSRFGMFRECSKCEHYKNQFCGMPLETTSDPIAKTMEIFQVRGGENAPEGIEVSVEF